MANVRFGISGTSSRSTFDGRFVKIIVFSRPMRFATREAASAEMPANRFAPEKIAPRPAGLTPKR